MDGKKKMGSSSSSSSFTSDLFGSNDSSGSGIFGSIFAPSSKVLGRESSRYEVPGKRQDSTSQVWGSKPGTQGTVPRSSGGENLSMLNGETSPFYQEQRVQPCHLSSSIYYGGQDIYANSQNPQGSVYSTFNKDWTEDDSGSASRGNWWQGSLYY
ncbi:uncharacterized protein LOC127789962 [Diospyros lotus]|uniref:uncharacterized protein LOC127789962 n=1 Tax=Diospyros lotus TaxID=55363 RepID=UPI0022564FED|nr:uncharacterized protein LOC127789962 [Diospyros lotus]